MNFRGATISVSLDEPDICPLCQHAIAPEVLSVKGYYDRDNAPYVAVVYLCHNCFKPFLGFYRTTLSNPRNAPLPSERIFVGPHSFSPREFDAHIKDVSPAFVEIYNQALAAESNSLDQIAGIGYRKALEFLIKDYLIHKEPEEADAIKAMALGNCIRQKIESEHLKIAASRCAWLGNDQTHYVQKYEEYDISDLKRLIEVTAHWIQMDLLTEEAAQIEHRGR